MNLAAKQLKFCARLNDFLWGIWGEKINRGLNLLAG